MNAQRADRGDNAPDAETDRCAFQFKHGYAFPAYLRDWLTGIEKTTPPGKTGVVLWHPKGAPVGDSLVLLTASAFAALLRSELPTGDGSPCARPDTPTDTRV
jgi:hypothetical protein